MRLTPRIWFALSLLLFVGAAYFWQLGEKRRKAAPAQESPASSAAPRAQSFLLTNPAPVTVAQSQPALLVSPLTAATNAAAKTNPFPYRLSNTSKSIAELMRDDSAVLLRHTLLDTSVAARPEIPAHLRSQGAPGSYIVQARGVITENFRKQLADAGAEIVSYVPNNAYLVTASEAAARRLAASFWTQAVLPYEPYYKLDARLLPLAVKRELSPFKHLNVLAFPGQTESAREAVQQLGGEVIGEPERTPFGENLVVKAPAERLAELAGLAPVQQVGVRAQKRLANDLSRFRVGISTNTMTAPPAGNYSPDASTPNLTGKNVLVSIVDSGVDATHPDFAANRISGRTTDGDGHGTHVAGTILGNGSQSGSLLLQPARGSVTNANFSGMAPDALGFAQLYFTRDDRLQERAALTNAIISNNSWGYFVNDYDLAAASYDAAVRDSLPGVTGEQSLVYVFAAGNSGGGGDGGLNGLPNSVLSPSTAKNVITVGATELPRNITNEVWRPDDSGVLVTNMPWAGMTDSSNQVAGLSSRGNVGIGIEGPVGRFKPDVVAPGTWVVSCKIPGFTYPTSFDRTDVTDFNFLNIAARGRNNYSILVPPNTESVTITISSNINSTVEIAQLRLDHEWDTFPDMLPPLATSPLTVVPPDNLGWTLFYSVTNLAANSVSFDLTVSITITNSAGNYFMVQEQLDGDLGQYYRYESGTSMSAGVVSGFLALMHEYFRDKFGVTNSPALMKALLISGARSLGPNYGMEVRGAVNHQGWGLPIISNSVPASLDNDLTTGPLRFFDTGVADALATGGAHTYTVSVPPEARSSPLRMTLVWTDPPGNPISSLKLVNDLDLFASGKVSAGGTNNTNTVLYVGNNFGEGSDFTATLITASTGSNAIIVTNVADTVAQTRDTVNNVENIFIRPPLASSYTVTVKAHRVNVNAVNSHPNGIVQDYALVIATGDSLSQTNTGTNAVSVPINLGATGPVFTNDPSPFVMPMQQNGQTNGIALLDQRVGANSALIISTNGATNQWSFFTFINPTSFTNVAILTFLPPNLSLPRNRDADIDLYVARGSQGVPGQDMFQLQNYAIASSTRSLGRSGTEFVIFSDAQPGEAFFIGVKSEDQQAATFGLFAAASENPFNQRDASNNIIARPLFLPVDVPDGTPDKPGGTNVFVLVTFPDVVQRVYITNTITHQQAGDLIGILSHRDSTDGTDAYATLNNHETFFGTRRVVYDDSDQGDLGDATSIPPVIPTDGPGTLRNFVGQSASGVWQFTISDNALFHTGRVEELTLVIQPASTNDTNAVLLTATVQPGRWVFAPVNVPFDAVEMEACVGGISPALPLGLYIRRGDFPDLATYDHYLDVQPPGACVTIGLGNSPPLIPGSRYFAGVYNPNSQPVTMTLRVTIRRGSQPPAFTDYESSGPTDLLDDAVTNSVIFVPDSGRIGDLQVGIRVDHPRSSDLVFHLVSPTGTRILLAENRGRTNALGYGADLGQVVTNVGALVLNNGFEETDGSAGPPRRVSLVTGDRFSGWRVDSGDINIVHDTFGLLGNSHSGTNAVDLNGESGGGSFSSNVVTRPNQLYRVSYAFCKNPGGGNQVAALEIDSVLVLTNSYNLPNSYTDLNWLTTSFVFRASAALTKVGFRQVSPQFGNAGMFIDTVMMDELDVVTNKVLYTTFTENTNLTATPIKFGEPPFTNNVSPFAAVLLDDGFDDIVIANYPSPPFDIPNGYFVSGWLVERDNIDIVGPNGGIGIPTHTPPYAIDLRGTSPGAVSTNVALTIGQVYRLSWAHLKNPSAVTPQAYTVAAVGIATNRFSAVDGTQWIETSMTFTSHLAAARILVSSDPGTAYVDSFKLENIGSAAEGNAAYFLPEESMRPFLGQNSFGAWTLEVWDSRLGGAVTGAAPQLVSWELRIAFPLTNPPAVLLTNGVPYTDRVTGTEVKYFIVDVPCPAGFMTNTLSCLTNPSSGLDLVFNQFTLPTNGFGDVTLLTAVTGTGQRTLLIGSPPLISATRYYLAVRNSNPAESNPFSIRVDAGCGSTIPDLQNRQPFTNVIADLSPFHYYRYNSSAGSVQLTFETAFADGNVDLYARRLLPPSLTFYTYRSTNPGMTEELVEVFPNSVPVSTMNVGPWFLGVTNLDVNPVQYVIQATEVLPSEVYALPLVGNTTIGRFQLPQGGADYYVVSVQGVPAPFNEVTITLRPAAGGGNVDLYVRHAAFPTTFTFDYLSTMSGTNQDAVAITTTSMPEPLVTGNWHVAVINSDPSLAADYTLEIRYVQPPAPIVAAVGFSGNTFALRWTAPADQQFQVQYTDVLGGDWQTIPTIVRSDTGEFTFFDDGSQTGGVSAQRFYRLVRVN